MTDLYDQEPLNPGQITSPALLTVGRKLIKHEGGHSVIVTVDSRLTKELSGLTLWIKDANTSFPLTLSEWGVVPGRRGFATDRWLELAPD